MGKKKFKDTSLNIKFCDGIEIINGEVIMFGCYIAFMDAYEFLEEFDIDEYMRLRDEFNI